MNWLFVGKLATTLQSCYNNPSVVFPLPVDIQLLGNEVFWTDGATSKCEAARDRSCVVQGRNDQRSLDFIVLLLKTDQPELYALHATEVLTILSAADERLQGVLEERLMIIMKRVGPGFSLALTQALRVSRYPPTAVAHLAARLALTFLTATPQTVGTVEGKEDEERALGRAIIDLLASSAASLALTDVTGPSGLLSHFVKLLHASTPHRTAALGLLLHVLSTLGRQVTLQDVEEAGLSASLLLDILDEQADWGPTPSKAELGAVIVSTFYSPVSLVRDRLLPLLYHALHTRQLPSQAVAESVVALYEKHRGLESLWVRDDKDTLALAARTVEFLVWAMGDVTSSPAAASLISMATALLSSLCRQLPRETAELIAIDGGGDELLQALEHMAVHALPREVVQPLLLLWLTLTFLVSKADRVRWACSLCGDRLQDLLPCAWVKEDLIGLLENLHREARRGGAEAGNEQANARAALDALVTAMLQSYHDISPSTGVRCADLLVEACDTERTRVMLMSCLRDQVPAIIRMLRVPDQTLRERAATLVSELLKLSVPERRILFEAYGSGANADANTSGEAADESVEDTRLFLLSDAGTALSEARRWPTAVDAEHFDRLHKSLEALVVKNSSVSVDQALGLAQGKAREAQQDGSLVMTPTTRENLKKVLELSRGGAPILLEGDTGVGKSATIMAAARLTEPPQRLVRFNMSRTVTIDELLGQVTMGKGGQFIFNKQPFTVAFEKGYWLLLDEINLAQDNVLQCIEEAIDTGTLVIKDSSEASAHVKKIPMHENFRLFATQNPNSGFFKVSCRHGHHIFFESLAQMHIFSKCLFAHSLGQLFLLLTGKA